MRATKIIMLSCLMMVVINQAQAGPVIIDGTDANQHGFSSDDKNRRGWLYMQRALEALGKQVPAKFPNVLIVLGTRQGSVARKAIESAFNHSSLAESGWDIKYKEGAQDIDDWLGKISVSNTDILLIPTYGETEGDLDPAEMAVINRQRLKIAQFVGQAGMKDQGGGLFAMAESGVDADGNKPYLWLEALIQGISVIDRGPVGIESSINLTDDGKKGLAGLPEDELAVAVPWHNYFEGNFGALTVWATAIDPDEPDKKRRNIILGGPVTSGDSADLSIVGNASPDPVSVGSTVTYTFVAANIGRIIAQNVKVIISIPGTSPPISCSSTGGGVCSNSGNDLIVTFTSLEPQAQATITVSATANCPPCGSNTIDAMATITSTTTDPDLNNNTSTIKITTMKGVPRAEVDKRIIEFDAITPKAAKLKKKQIQSATLKVSNTGCARLVIKLKSITRIREADDPRGIGDTDDRDFFSILAVNPDAPATRVKIGDEFVIEACQQRSFLIEFNPSVPPAFICQVKNLPANLVLPRRFTSVLTILEETGSSIDIRLIGKITPRVILIDPSDTRKPPLISLERRGKNLVVDFTVYDSDPRDIQSARYEFLDAGGNVKLTESISLIDPINNSLAKDMLTEGQSFIVRTEFPNVKEGSRIASVRLTVSGKTQSANAAGSSPITGCTLQNAFRQSGQQVMPVVEIEPLLRKGKVRPRR
jgi:uncharacterized repeat protein (TIGR01451 family)